MHVFVDALNAKGRQMSKKPCQNFSTIFHKTSVVCERQQAIARENDRRKKEDLNRLNEQLKPVADAFAYAG